MTPEYLYRYEDVAYDTGIRIHMRKFKVLKATPCGYWISLFDFDDDKKWVSKTSRKRFAYPSLTEAMVNFKARKNRQIKILDARLSRARLALHYAKQLERKNDESNSL